MEFDAGRLNAAWALGMAARRRAFAARSRKAETGETWKKEVICSERVSYLRVSETSEHGSLIELTGDNLPKYGGKLVG
jgi:hypothetical protein